MQNKEYDYKDYLLGHSKSTKDYIQLVRTNLKSFLIIFAVISILAVAYALHAKNIYESTVSLKIVNQKKNVLQKEPTDATSSDISDRYIANEIKIIEDYGTRERVAIALIDSVENLKDKSKYKLLTLKNGETGIKGHRTVGDIAGLLKTIVKTEQETGTDLVHITVEFS